MTTTRRIEASAERRRARSFSASILCFLRVRVRLSAARRTSGERVECREGRARIELAPAGFR